jgi:anaerobic magnesium-protoporphyrin IX monomethyl ester cyclase
MAELHGDVWDMLPMEKYRAHNWQCFGTPGSRQPYASVATSLGCPFACGFCCINAPFVAATKGKHRYRMRDPRAVVDEVDKLYRTYDVKAFKIVDEMFVLNERHYTAICEGLAALPYASELNIWAYARVDTVKPEKLTLLRSAGIRWLALGIESGSAHVRDGADKSFEDSDIYGIVQAIQDAGIHVLGNFIFGLPDDTKLSMLATLDLAKHLSCEFANFYSAMAYPGSRLYDEAVAQALPLPKRWSGFSQHSADCHPLPTATLSAAEVLAFRDAAFREYFAAPGYLAMIERKFGADTVAHIRAMSARALKRELLAVA